MKLISLQLAAVSVLSILAFSYNGSHAGSAGMELASSGKKKYAVGAVDPAVQKLVDQFHAWALAKTINPNTTNIAIAIPTANTSKRIKGNGTKLTQEIMNDAAITAARDFGYGFPMQHILNADIGIKLSKFMVSTDEFIYKHIAHKTDSKQKALLEARDILRKLNNKEIPLEAKVLGPAEMVDMYKETRKDHYCKTVSCDVPRMKVVARLIATPFNKLQAAGVLDDEDLEAFREATTFTYYFVQKDGQWAFEEVNVGYGVGFMLAKTSF